MVAAHYKKDDLLNCWTSSSDISGYHADFHEGHGTVGVWQGARHAVCESALRNFCSGCCKVSQKSGSGCELFLGCGRRSLESLASYIEALDVGVTFTCLMFGKPHI